MIVMNARPCETYEAFADRMAAKASAAQQVILGEFNEHTLEARPGMDREDILKEFYEIRWQDYFGNNQLAEANAAALVVEILM